MYQKIKWLIGKLRRQIIFILLTCIGGFLDAYTYLLRGKVFANAQTGNLVLFGVNLLEGRIAAFRYLIPVGAFVIGIFVSHLLQDTYRERGCIDWKLLILIVEMLAVFGIGWVPPSIKTNNVVNILVSFITALQYGAFRTINGKPFATTMCTGMLRSGTDYLYKYYSDPKTNETLHISISYFFIIGMFCIGCFCGSVLVALFGQYASFVCGGCFFVVIAIYISEKKREESKEAEYAS